MKLRALRRFGAIAAVGLAAAAPAWGQTPAKSYTGFYLGGDLGYGSGWSTSNFGINGVGSPGLDGSGTWAPFGFGGNLVQQGSGGFYGLHAGYDHQWANNFVGGVELGFVMTDLSFQSGDSFPGLLPGKTYRTDIRWMGTIAPRIGFNYQGFLLYGKAGLAVARVASTLTAQSGSCGIAVTTCSFSDEHYHFGYTLGAGVEYLLTRNWMLGLEYDYFDLGSERYAGLTAPDTTWQVNYSLRPQFSAVRARVSYKFGAPDQAQADAPPPPPRDPAVADWSGIYFGGNVGYGKANYTYSFAPDGGSLFLFGPPILGGSFGTAASGGIYGLHAGANQQWDRVVAGLEIGVALADITAQTGTMFGTDLFVVPGATYTTNIKWLATLTPRIGFAWNDFLFYGKGGVAAARISSRLNTNDTSTFGFTTSFTDEKTMLGWVVGVGAEYQIAKSWVLGVEYNYMDFGAETFGGNPTPDTTWPISYTVRPTISAVRARVSFKM